MKLHYLMLHPMAIDLPVCEYVPMIVTVAGYEKNYDWLGLGRNLAWFVVV